MLKIERDEVLEYFNNISKDYDINNEKLYWKLSDKLLWNIIENNIYKNEKISFLDLGGGTGTWSKLILDNYPLSTGILIDYSNGMLEQASIKLGNYSNRIKTISCDINDLVIDEQFDFILNIYFLPFFKNIDYLIRFISSHLKQNGRVLSVAENYYNGLALNILKSNMENVNKMEQNKVGKLSENVPMLKFHTIEEISKLYIKYNIDVKNIYGFPVVSSIGYLEGLTSENNSISKILSTNFDDIYNVETKYIMKKSLANRGKYICVVGEKNKKES